MLETSNKVPVLRERETPSFGEDECLIQVRAVSIHPVDLETRDGKNAMMLPFSRPFIPGVDFVGVLVDKGSGVTDIQEGERVFGYRGIGQMGAFAEQIVVKRSELAKAPEDIDVNALATMPLPALCALQALDESAPKDTKRILVHGGAGGVGSIAVQIFAAKGYEVIATASAAQEDWVRALGASDIIDYKTQRFEDVVSDLDMVFDTVGGETLKRSFAVVKDGGTVVSLNAMPAADVLRKAGMKLPIVLGWLLPVMRWSLTSKAKKSNASFSAQVTVPSGHRLDELTHIARERGIQSRIGRIFPFEELPTAMDHAESGSAQGRVVVSLA